MKRIQSQQQYSYYMKRAQITVILIALIFFGVHATKLFSHLDLHFHSIEWEAEQEEREKRKPQVEEWNTMNPDATKEEKDEAEADILEGKMFVV